MRTRARLIAAAFLLAVVVPALPRASAGDEPAAAAGGIQWFATWAQAAKEAERTQRPILLVAAAPHCKNISGIW